MSLFIVIIILVVKKMKKWEKFTYNNIKHDQLECQLDGYLNNNDLFRPIHPATVEYHYLWKTHSNEYDEDVFFVIIH